MLVPARSLGSVSDEARQAVAAAGGTIVQKPPSPGWVGPFPEPLQYIAVFPGGLQISADNLSYAISASDPGSERSIIQQMLTTVAYEQTGSVPQAVAAAQQIVPPTIPMAYTGIYASQAPAPVAAAAPAAKPAPTPAQITQLYYPRVSLSNLSRPGSSAFQVGDEWVLQIGAAPPNESVTAAAIHNGRSLGTSRHGSTNAAGFFSLAGRMSENEIGHWEERWSVRDYAASPALSFDVVASVGQQQADSRLSVTGGGSSAAWRATAPEQTPESTAGAPSSGLPAAADQVMGVVKSIPWYVWAAAAAAALLLSRRSR